MLEGPDDLFGFDIGISDYLRPFRHFDFYTLRELIHTMRYPAKHESLAVLPVELPTTSRKVGIITLKNRTLSPLAQLFADIARDLAKPLAKIK